jgi:hypothetical protein
VLGHPGPYLRTAHQDGHMPGVAREMHRRLSGSVCTAPERAQAASR